MPLSEAAALANLNNWNSLPRLCFEPTSVLVCAGMSVADWHISLPGWWYYLIAVPAEWCACRAEVTMTDCTMGSIHIQDAWHNSFNLVCWAQLQPQWQMLNSHCHRIERAELCEISHKFKGPRCITCHPYISKHVLETFFFTRYVPWSVMLQNQPNDWNYMSFGEERGNKEQIFFHAQSRNQRICLYNQVLFCFVQASRRPSYFAQEIQEFCTSSLMFWNLYVYKRRLMAITLKYKVLFFKAGTFSYLSPQRSPWCNEPLKARAGRLGVVWFLLIHFNMTAKSQIYY